MLGKVTGGCRGDGEQEQKDPVLAVVSEAHTVHPSNLSQHTHLSVPAPAFPELPFSHLERLPQLSL